MHGSKTVKSKTKTVSAETKSNAVEMSWDDTVSWNFLSV